MLYLLASILLVLLCGAQSLSYNPADYIEVYPDPTDPEVLKGRTPLYFSHIVSLEGQYVSAGTVAGVKVALDRINNDSNLLPGYTLHYTLADCKVVATILIMAILNMMPSPDVIW